MYCYEALLVAQALKLHAPFLKGFQSLNGISKPDTVSWEIQNVLQNWNYEFIFNLKKNNRVGLHVRVWGLHMSFNSCPDNKYKSDLWVQYNTSANTVMLNPLIRQVNNFTNWNEIRVNLHQQFWSLLSYLSLQIAYNY